MLRLLILLLTLLVSSIVQGQDIYRAACDGNIKKLDSLLKTTDINIKNRTESTPLHFTALCRQNEAFDYLIEHGANVNIINTFGNTPLFYAVQSANIKMVKSLLNKGAIVDVINKQGRTPLFVAVQSNNEELFDLLLSRNADTNIRDNLGISILHNAVLNNNLKLIKQLVNDKTEIDVVNDRGNTPLEIAVRENFVEVAEFLIAKGADRAKVKTYNFKGDLLGQVKPGLASEMFAPNFISTEYFNHSATFYPDEKEFYYTIESRVNNGGVIMVSKSVNGKWTAPKPANIQGNYREIDPFITRDGSALYYSSDRPAKKGDTVTGNIDLWMVKRKGKTWDVPIHLGEEVNTPDADWFPTVSNKGTLFFSTGPGRSSNIVYSEFKDGKYQKAIPLGDSVNSEFRDYDPMIAPDESYVVFSSNRPGGFGSVDLYVSFKNSDGSWTKAKNLGEAVNTKTIEFAPGLSHDGNYLFFNREGDIHWIDSKVIQNLK